MPMQGPWIVRAVLIKGKIKTWAEINLLLFQTSGDSPDHYKWGGEEKTTQTIVVAYLTIGDFKAFSNTNEWAFLVPSEMNQDCYCSRRDEETEAWEGDVVCAQPGHGTVQSLSRKPDLSHRPSPSPKRDMMKP